MCCARERRMQSVCDCAWRHPQLGYVCVACNSARCASTQSGALLIKCAPHFNRRACQQQPLTCAAIAHMPAAPSLSNRTGCWTALHELATSAAALARPALHRPQHSTHARPASSLATAPRPNAHPLVSLTHPAAAAKPLHSQHAHTQQQQAAPGAAQPSQNTEYTW